jgi:hypothetical protein
MLGLLFVFGYVGSSARRITREHGLRLPASAHAFLCRGDAWKHTFIDSAAASAFEMDSVDVPLFVSQLKVRPLLESCGPGLPSNSQYQISRPWLTGPATKAYCCESPTGDWLTVQIWRIDGARVGVVLYTDWN